jgi:hypothetical protein
MFSLVDFFAFLQNYNNLSCKEFANAKNTSLILGQNCI